MGQKVNPEGFRLGIVKNWKSRWYEEKDYALRVQEDLKIRNFIRGKITEKRSDPSKNKRLILKNVSFLRKKT